MFVHTRGPFPRVVGGADHWLNVHGKKASTSRRRGRDRARLDSVDRERRTIAQGRLILLLYEIANVVGSTCKAFCLTWSRSGGCLHVTDFNCRLCLSRSDRPAAERCITRRQEPASRSSLIREARTPGPASQIDGFRIGRVDRHLTGLVGANKFGKGLDVRLADTQGISAHFVEERFAVSVDLDVHFVDGDV